jgi:hypothetical protein
MKTNKTMKEKISLLENELNEKNKYDLCDYIQRSISKFEVSNINEKPIENFNVDNLKTIIEEQLIKIQNSSLKIREIEDMKLKVEMLF